MDESDIRRFLDESYPKVVGAVALVAGDLATAEDAVQEAIVRAWERRDRGDRIDDLEPWVATVAMNLSRSRLRHLRVERRARPRLVAAASTDGPSGDAIDVRRALATPPRRQREAAVLRFYLDRTTEEIASAMGTSHGTVKSQLAKARAHLADALDVPDGEKESRHADV
jgi:RNA polymerase sigma-70 factor (ECF subfamily)